MKAFARDLSEDDIEELLALRKPDGLPLHWGYIPYLLTVHPHSERIKWGKRVARHGWSAPELRSEIRKKRPRKHAHGRSIKRPATPEAGLRQLTADAELWIRRCEVVMEVVREKAKTKSAADSNVLTDAERVFEGVARTARKASQELKRLNLG